MTIQLSEAAEVIVDDNHVYSEAGIICPRSATGLLKKYGLGMDFSKIPAHIVEKARVRGNAVDAGFRLIAEGLEIDPETVSPAISGYLDAFRKFWHESGAELIEVGVPRISPLGFGFTTDLWLWIGGKRTIVDGKATFKIPKSVGPQTAFYQIGSNSLFPQAPTEDRAALWLKPNGTYKYQTLEDPDDFTAAMDCLDEDLRREQAEIKLTKWRIRYGE